MSGPSQPVSASSQPPGGLVRDHFDYVANLGQQASRVGLGAGLVLALLMHGSGATAAALAPWEIRAFASQVQQRVKTDLRATIDVEPIEPVEQPLTPEEPPEPEVAAPEVAPEPAEALDASDAPEAAPAAAEMGQVLAQEPDPSEPLDLTDQGFIQGTGTRFSGGVSARDGSATQAVRTRRAKAGGVPGGQGEAENGSSRPPAVDKSRPAGLLSATVWSDCDFPPEASASNVNLAYVQLVVTVGPDGSPRSVNVVSVSEPGLGFERIARQCAMRKRFDPGLDTRGNRITTATPPFKVRFVR